MTDWRNVPDDILQEEIGKLGGAKIENMTVRDLMTAMDNLRAMDRETFVRESARSRPVQPAYQMPKYIPRPMKEKKKPRNPDRELAVGKYILTIMAAVLCLGALCVFLASFWFALPGILQFAIVAALGGGLWAVGMKFSDKSMRPFWLGVAGLGAGACYIAILAGSMVWYLYDIIGIGVLAVGWMLAATACCVKKRAAVFSLIAYAGGLASLGLAGLMFGTDEPYSGTIAAVLSIAAAGACGAGYVKLRKRILLYAHMGYCMAACGMLGEYPGAVACIAGIVLLGSCLWLLRELGWDKSRNGAVINAVHTAALAVYLGRFASGYGTAGAALAAIIIIACNFGAVPGYAVGCVFPAVSLLSVVSSEWLESVAGIPVATAVMLVCFWHRFKDSFERRLAVRAVYVWSAALVLVPELYVRHWLNVILAMVLLLGLGIWYRCSYDHGIWDDWDLEIISVLCVAGLLLESLVEAGVLWASVPVAICLLLLQAYRMKYDVRFESISLRAKTAWHVFYGMAYMSLTVSASYASVRYDDGARLRTAILGGAPHVAECLFVAVILILSTAFLAWLAIKNGRAWQCVASCASSQWHLWAVAGLFGFSNHVILLDVAGMLLAAGCVAMGFLFYKKPLRQCGLACAILYGLKLGILDVMLAGSGAALGLLVAGGLSFGMSAAYNSLGRKYLRSEAENQE